MSRSSSGRSAARIVRARFTSDHGITATAIVSRIEDRAERALLDSSRRTMLCQCWCQRTYKRTTPDDVAAGIAPSCGHEDCRAPL